MPNKVNGGLKLRHLSEEEVSKILKISRPTLREWKRQEKIKFYQIGSNTSPCLYEPDNVRMAVELRVEEIMQAAKEKADEIRKLADEKIPPKGTT